MRSATPADAAWPLEGAAVTTLLRTFETPPRLLGLGEAMHGAEALLRRRNAIFRHLVEHEGFRSVAIESDCLAGTAVDAYVTEGTGTLDGVMRRGFSHGFGESAANRELVRWMREHNRERPASERVRFFGFDGPLEVAGPAAPRQALAGLHGYLAAHLHDAPGLGGAAHVGDPDHERVPPFDVLDDLLGPDERWTDPAATLDPARSIGRSAEAVSLRLIADDLMATLLAQSPHLIAATSREAWWRASLYGRTATGLLRYHAGMADTSPSRVERLMSLRDAMMADNLLSIADAYGPALVCAHNRHLQRDKSTWLAPWRPGGLALEWWSAGAIAGAHLGGAYAFIASAVGAAPHHGLDVPRPDTVEGVLYALPGGDHLIDSGRLTEAVGDAALKPRTAATESYFPLDPGRLGQTDGIAFVKDLPAG
ncbi:erythromycin esterase [Nonomuraea phyllanthi]|uniref:erythromycin esterase family protein n=1 Tax=Nonomuraea phyllanthi TaxID=2219224 RepID=UPI0012935397|nr:erythromycin esterase family protein [Nonomuraea phyllanthi]QFY10396.1 erythromycin esterase [Nonomuraea phyllanthi]